MDNLTFLHFTSTVDFNLNINGNFVKTANVIDSKYITIATSNKQVYFTYQPISTTKTYMPFTQVLKIHATSIEAPSQFVKIVPFKNRHYEVHLTPPLTATNTLSNIIADEYFGKLNIVALNNNAGNVFVYENTKLKKQYQTPIITQAEIAQQFNYITIKCSVENQRYHLIVINIDSLQTVYDLPCDGFEQADSTLKAIVKMHDLAQQATVHSVDLSNGETQTFKVYLNQSPTKTTNKYLIPLAFLEALQHQNYPLAKSYLSPQLQDAPDSHFQEYFGNIKEIYFDRYNLTTPQVGYTVESKTGYNHFEFAISDGVITEISR